MLEEDSWFGALITGNEGLGTLFVFGLSGSSSQFQNPTYGTDSGTCSGVRNSLRKQLGQFLRQKRGEMTLRQFTRVTGLSSSTLQRLELAEQNLTLDSLENLLRRMGVTIRDVFRD